MTSAWVTWQKSFFRGMNTLNCLAVGAGGFTTFSTFALETAGLMQSGRIGASAAYMLLSVTLSVAAVLLAEGVV